jgi:hypothetical protein
VEVVLSISQPIQSRKLDLHWSLTSYVLVPVSSLHTCKNSIDLSTLGGKCGATYIDRNLYSLLSTRFGAHFESLSDREKGPGSEFMRNFESVKRSFGLRNDQSEREVHGLRMPLASSDFWDSDEKDGQIDLVRSERIVTPTLTDSASVKIVSLCLIRSLQRSSN